MKSSILILRYVRQAYNNTLSQWKELLFGQFLSILLAVSSGTTSELKVTCSINAPTSLLVITYFMMSIHIVPHVLNELKRQNSANTMSYVIPMTKIRLSSPWYLYLLSSILDLEAFFFMVLATRYTTITNVILLNVLSVPGAMITSYLILDSRYKPFHIIGILICAAGVVLSVFHDYEEESEKSNEVLGDVFAALGGILSGVNDAVAELLVKRCGVFELVGMVGIFGFCFSILQAVLMETEEAQNIFDETSNTCERQMIAVLVLIYICSTYLKSLGDAWFLLRTEATLMNLLFLTSDFYAIIFSIFAEGIFPSPFFFMAFVLVIFGLVVYQVSPSPTPSKINIRKGNENEILCGGQENSSVSEFV